MTEPLSMAVHPFRNPDPPTDSPQSFQQILADKDEGHLQVPEHQRTPGAWNERKKSEYIARLRQAINGCHPPGSIATYQLVAQGSVSATFLNDGLQRITALEELRADPSRFGMDQQGTHDLLRIKISVQHRHYESHQDAMRDFQYINNGTHLTSYELCRGYLTYMDHWKAIWEPLLDEVQEAVRYSESLLRLRTSADNREAEHKRRRDTLALFHRFLTGERRHSTYSDVGAKDIARYLAAGSVIEQILSAELLTKGSEDVVRNVKTFRRFLEDETALLHQHVQDVLGDGNGLSPVSHRWLLHLAVWRRNNSVPRDEHVRFVDTFLRETGGRAIWKGPEATRHSVTLGLASIGHLPTLADYAGMPGFCERQRRVRGPKLRPGYDNSHYLPYATNGNGPTFPEPAPINRARGAQPAAGPDRAA